MRRKYYTLSVFFAMLACQTAVAQVRHANGLRGYAAEAEAAMVEQVQRTETWGDWYGAVLTTPMPTKVHYYFYEWSGCAGGEGAWWGTWRWSA